MIDRYSKILDFIVTKHGEQVDKAGKPYFLHPITVALLCQNESEKIVALLHDILEDTNTLPQELLALGVTSDELNAIQLLTKPKNEDYLHYIKRVSKNPIARHVKMADLTHNMDLSRLPYITDKDIQRKNKYLQAYNTLKAEDDIIEER
jgi:(p)ppGpp synthase/HD superfamily hydrolase